MNTPAQTILWRDLFVLIDNGKSRASDYVQFGALILEQRGRYKEGIGGLVIIPENATPPPDDVRQAINDALKALESGLLCFCWLVEGRGFQGAVARGVLTGIRLFGRYSYPTHVTTDLGAALDWLLPHLPGAGRAGVEAATVRIRAERELPVSRLSA
jgi:hypothetical protein